MAQLSHLLLSSPEIPISFKVSGLMKLSWTVWAPSPDGLEPEGATYPNISYVGFLYWELGNILMVWGRCLLFGYLDT